VAPDLATAAGPDQVRGRLGDGLSLDWAPTLENGRKGGDHTVHRTTHTERER
jgi:hypothetical protein